MDDEALAELARSESSELALFGRLGAAAIVPTRLVRVGETPAPTPGAMDVVRSAAPTEKPFFAAVLAENAQSPQITREVGALFAEAALGTSPTRFATLLSREATADEVEAVLGRLAAAQLGGPLPPVADRLAFLIERAFARNPSAMLVRQTLDPAARNGLLLTRDLRSGLGPARGQIKPSVRALLAPMGPLVPLTELGDLAPAARERLTSLASTVEAELRRPARIAFQVSERGVEVVAITPLAHAGRAAVVLAADLVDRGVLQKAEALTLVAPNDLTGAIELRLEPEEGQIVGRGVAAGGGIAIGHACLATSRAVDLDRANLSPVLFVEELVPEDSGALGVSQGVVTVRGGITGEAAIMARALAKPCVASGPALTLAGGAAVAATGMRIEEGDRVAIDGGTGLIVRGACRRRCEMPEGASKILAWTSEHRKAPVLATVAHEHDVTSAIELGADGLLVLVPEAVCLSADRDFKPEALARALARLLEAAGPDKRLYVDVDPTRRPSFLAGLTSDAVTLAAAEASRLTGRAVLLLGSDAPPLWRAGPADPGGPAVVFAEPQTLDQATRRVSLHPGGLLACAPKLVPAARLALAREALRAAVFTDPT